ncbi:hypothetical protein JG688_00009437 [Phytophthora aleatoria]|uniref:ribonuclease H n=1 Tax=Phytophthora aleatoria TaxID=2496075 RepID=A0A8J5IG78_9STRA|nr:hypothetical protein JG688_00009437 [Phytophthora aleatoria]
MGWDYDSSSSSSCSESSTDMAYGDSSVHSDNEEMEEAGEEEKEQKDLDWYYAVVIGRCRGIFTREAREFLNQYGLQVDHEYQHFDCSRLCPPNTTRWPWDAAPASTHAVDQVHGYPNFRVKKFLNYDEAQAFIDYYNEGSESTQEEQDPDWYYAVAVGRCTGIFTDVNDALSHTRGYSNAKFIKFPTFDEARNFLSNWDLDVQDGHEFSDGSRCWFAFDINGGDPDYQDPKHPDSMVAFCDGTLEWARTEDPYEYKVLYNYSDSSMLINSMTNWIYKWHRNGWTTVSGTEVKNRDILEQLLDEQGGRQVVWRHVRAHRGNQDWESYWNDIADTKALMGWFEYDSDNGYEYFEPSEYYAVAVGRNPGIYTRHEDAVEQVFGFPGFRMRRFDDYEDARDYLEEFDIFYDSETEGSDLEEEPEDESDGRSTGIFLSSAEAMEQVHRFPGFRMKKFRDYDAAEEYIAFNQVYSSDEEETKSEQEEDEKWYYAVAVGRCTGIYTDWEEARTQVHGYSGSRMKKFLVYDEALKYLSQNRLYYGEEEEEKSEESEEETWHYAVAVGRRVGTYTDHQDAVDQDAKEQVHCYSGFRMEKFLDCDEAQAYIDFNQVYSSSEEWDSDEDTSQGAETWYYAVAVGRSTGVYTDWQ